MKIERVFFSVGEARTGYAALERMGGIPSSKGMDWRKGVNFLVPDRRTIQAVARPQGIARRGGKFWGVDESAINEHLVACGK